MEGGERERGGREGEEGRGREGREDEGGRGMNAEAKALVPTASKAQGRGDTQRVKILGGDGAGGEGEIPGGREGVGEGVIRNGFLREIASVEEIGARDKRKGLRGQMGM